MIKLLTVLFLTITVNFNFAFASESKPKSSCAPNQHWVRAHNQREYVKADGTFVRASFRAAHCQNNPKSYAFWKDKLTNVRPPNWPDANKSEKHKKWTDEEIERMLEALNELPEVLWGRTIKSISRMDKSIYQNNPGSGVPGHIVIYDEAFSKDRSLARVIAHELAHALYSEGLPPDGQTSYNEQAGWYNFGKTSGIWRTVSNRFVEADGAESPEEDFSNNIEYFLFNPAKLKSVSPTVFEWIDNRFGAKMKLRGR